jgi:hypothetical protein
MPASRGPILSAPANCDATRAVSADQVRTFRRRSIENDYRLVRVRSLSKRPLSHEWQHGDRPDLLFSVQQDALNTGLLVAGLRCIDCDIDDPQLALKIVEVMRQHLPVGALIRRRGNSPRLAMLFRAADGQPPKRAVAGPRGKLEVLGFGQQVVVHGVHPSGAVITWSKGRGPDTVRYDELPAVSEEQISPFLTECAPLLGASVSEPGSAYAPVQGNGVLEPGFGLAPTPSPSLAPIENDLGAGIESPNWFSALTADEKRALVRACLNAQDNRTSDPRDNWLRAIFAVADAEQLGCPDARQLALEWSRRGASWTSEADFNTAWGSYKPKPGGVTVGSLLAMARCAGLDLSPWRDPALARSPGAGAAQGAPSISSPSPQPASGRALCTADLPIVPPKRQWLHGTDLVRGSVSLLVAPGGRGKSSWLVTLSLACASNRSLLGAHIFGGPLSVLLIRAEDPTTEVALRLRAAMKHHSLSDSDVQGLHVIGADRWGLALLCPGATGPMLNKAGWDELIAELDRLEPDVLILDPLINLMGGVSQNDNAAVALLMRRLVELAAKRKIAIMLAHHAAKGRDPASAESAMGAATFVNLCRVALGIEPLEEKDAGKLGLPPWDAKLIFRIVGTKQNYSPPDDTQRWFRQVSVTMQNAEPPIYPNGDKVGVVEPFKPGASGPVFPQSLIRDALLAIDGANPPLSPSKRSSDRYGVPVIAQAIAQHRGGHATGVEGQSVLDHMISTGLVVVADIKVSRPGSRSDTRKGLTVTSAGQAAIDAGAPPQSPQSPATSIRDDAGGAPLGPPQRPRGCGGNAGGNVAGTSSTEGAPNLPTTSNVTHQEFDAALAAAVADLDPPVGEVPELPSIPEVRSSAPDVHTPGAPTASAAPLPAHDIDYPDMLPFLDRRKPKPAAAHAAGGSGPDSSDDLTINSR